MQTGLGMCCLAEKNNKNSRELSMIVSAKIL